MKTLLSLAIATVIALPAVAAPRAAAQRDSRPSVAAVCRGDALPFSLLEDTAELATDSDFESLVADLWEAYCEDAVAAPAGSYQAKACACRGVMPNF